MIRRPIKGVAISPEQFGNLLYPVMCTPKVDGFRCILANHPLTSRLSLFPNKHFHRKLGAYGSTLYMLDGEVTVGDIHNALQRTSSGLTSVEGKPDFTYHVFDVLVDGELDAAYHRRYSLATKIVKDLGCTFIKMLKAEVIDTPDALESYLDEQLELGYEGIVVRSITGKYKEGKSTLREQYMLKVKPFDDSEGYIVGFFEEQYNNNEIVTHNDGKNRRRSLKENKVAKGTLGGLILRDVKSGVEVRVGGGFTAHQRRHLWDYRNNLKGKVVKYKFQAVGAKDKPRHPIFVDFRPIWDV